MDPVEFIWEVAQALFALITAVALPAVVIWWLARRSRSTMPHDNKFPRRDRS